MYSEVTDQLFMKDLDFLRKEENQIIREVSSDATLRLTSMGLLFEVHEIPKFNVNTEDGNLYYGTRANKNEKKYFPVLYLEQSILK